MIGGPTAAVGGNLFGGIFAGGFHTGGMIRNVGMNEQLVTALVKKNEQLEITRPGQNMSDMSGMNVVNNLFVSLDSDKMFSDSANSPSGRDTVFEINTQRSRAMQSR